MNTSDPKWCALHSTPDSERYIWMSTLDPEQGVLLSTSDPKWCALPSTPYLERCALISTLNPKCCSLHNTPDFEGYIWMRTSDPEQCMLLSTSDHEWCALLSAPQISNGASWSAQKKKAPRPQAVHSDEYLGPWIVCDPQHPTSSGAS